LVLWVTVLAAIVAIAHVSESRSSATLARETIDRLQLKATLEAAVIHRIGQLLGIAISQPANGLIGGIAVEVVSERQKTDLNTAHPANLESALARHVGAAEAKRLAARILDWRDADDLPSADGAETAAYLAAGLKRRPRNGPFEHVAELGQVIGVSPALVRRLRSEFTVYSGLKGGESTGSITLAAGTTSPAVGEAFSLVANGQLGGQTLSVAATVMLTGNLEASYRILAWEWIPVWN